MGVAAWRILAGAVAALAAAPVARADVTPRTVEVVMTATVVEATGGGMVRRTDGPGSGPARPFTLADLPDFPLAPGAGFALGWRASGAGLEPFFDEDGLPICQPFHLAGVSAGPARDDCTNSEAAATLLFASLPFADRLADEPVAEGPNIYLGDYSLDLIYAPSTFWSVACCAYDYDWDDRAFERSDKPGLFNMTGLPHAGEGAFVGGRGWLSYAFDIDGDDVAGTGFADIRFAVEWRFRNYDTTGIPAPAGTFALGLGVLTLARRRRHA
jgi:hypothetical protein